MSIQKLEKRRLSETGVTKSVKKELEELVEALADKYEVLPFTVRNTALAYGLIVLLFAGIPRNDWEFLRLIERVQRIVKEEVGTA